MAVVKGAGSIVHMGLLWMFHVNVESSDSKRNHENYGIKSAHHYGRNTFSYDKYEFVTKCGH